MFRTCLGMLVVNLLAVVTYAVILLLNFRVDIKSPPEHVLHTDKIEISTIYHPSLRVLHFVLLPGRFCEGRQNENRSRESTMK